MRMAMVSYLEGGVHYHRVRMMLWRVVLQWLQQQQLHLPQVPATATATATATAAKEQ